MAIPVKKNQNDRLDLRISSEDKALIETAASLKGLKMSSFVIENMRQAARQVIEASRTISLSDRAWDQFVDLLNTPPEPTESLKRAFKNLKANS